MSKTVVIRQAFTFQVEENVFATPWNESDVIFVVQDTEFHVHRSILKMQSPVFKRMLDGHFKEARQDKITLKGKSSKDMLQFLKLLYPHNMIRKPLISFKEGNNLFKMLVLADEFQAENVIYECLEKTVITRGNAMTILPFAVKYNQLVRAKCVQIIKRSVSTDQVEGEIAELDNEVAKQLLVAKCHFLESTARKGNDMILHLLEQVIKYKTGTRKSTYLDAGKSTTTGNCLFGHEISVDAFHQARHCENCLKAYKKKFVDKAVLHQDEHGVVGRGSKPSREEALFDLLKETDDVVTALGGNCE